MESQNTSYMNDYWPARLEQDQLAQLQQLEAAMNAGRRDKVILMALSPKQESWGDM